MSFFASSSSSHLALAPWSLPGLEGYSFHSPWWFAALLVLPLLVWLRGHRGAPVLVIPFASAWHRPSRLPAARWAAGFALTGLVLLIGALARPQFVEDKREVKQQGYDLMLAIDLSGSMLAEDYAKDTERINRLQAIQPVIQAFVHRRPNDRIGLVIFSGRAYTLSPLTFDHDWLARQIGRISVKMIIGLERGTAVGDGLGVALSRLEQAKHEAGAARKGAFVILLTDGANNTGLITPLQSAEVAKSRQIPVYTIGIGRPGYVDMPQIMPDGSFATYPDGRKIYRRDISDLDENTLIKISEVTGAKFFRAKDSDTIEKTFAAIDAAQKIEYQAKSYLITTELFHWLAIPGAVLLFLGALIALPPRRRSRPAETNGGGVPSPRAENPA